MPKPGDTVRFKIDIEFFGACFLKAGYPATLEFVSSNLVGIIVPVYGHLVLTKDFFDEYRIPESIYGVWRAIGAA